MKLLILLSVLVTTGYSYKILCVFPLPSRSHNQLAWGVVNTLLKAGHEVTWATPYPKYVKKDPPKSLKVIDVSSTRVYINESYTIKIENFVKYISYGQSFADNVTRKVINTPALRDAIVSTQYDAVFTQAFYSEILAGLAAVQQVPWLLINASPINPFLEALVDQVRSVPIVPIFYNYYTLPLSFPERILSTFTYALVSVSQWLDRKNTSDFYETLFEPLAKARGVPLPTFDEARNNVSILFMNSHESVTPALTTPPNVINVAGFHIDDEPLSQELQTLLDSAKLGVIYCNTGTVLPSSPFPVSIRNDLIRTFGKMKETVLWKFDTEILVRPPLELTHNVNLRRWVPQTSVLAHPRVNLFVTNGELLSTIEAVKAGVPFLVLPVFKGQSVIAERAVRAGYARRVELSDNMTDALIENMMEMVNNKTYKKRMMEMSRLFHSRPVSPAKLLVHYTELAIKTKGAYHLRSTWKKYAWYQRWMIDQVASILILLALFVKIFWLIILTWYRLCKSEDIEEEETEEPNTRVQRMKKQKKEQKPKEPYRRNRPKWKTN